MSANASRARPFMFTGFAVALVLAGGVVMSAGADEATKQAIPDFGAAQNRLWVLQNGTAYFPVPGDKGPGPIVQRGVPYEHDGQVRIAETNNPILQPWARKLMDEANERVEAGGLPFVTTSRCWPGGVPGLLLYPGEPVLIVQKPNEVWILYQRDEQIRRVYLNVPHSKNPGYSWYGESVGHYENGDTLVVDTVGLDDKAPIDRYRTPHTRQLHVVERYRLTKGGKNIEVQFTVEDPGAFTMPWKAKVDYGVGAGARAGSWVESVCNENPNDYFVEGRNDVVPNPHADKPDF